MNYTVYLVSKDDNMSRIMALYMQQKGWNLKLISSVAKSIEYIPECPNLWIFDLERADLMNFEVIHMIKLKKAQTPIIFTSSKVDSADRLMTLELGVDDIMEKPFSPKELIIKSLRLMDRSYIPLLHPNHDQVLRLQHYIINESTRTVEGRNENLILTSKEFDLLVLFARNCGHALSRNQILVKIWGVDAYYNDRAVDDLVRRLRKKLTTLRIETVYGYGYRACH